jgi:ABC-2 type transport system permease protein
MKLIVYLKITLKSIISTGIITIAMYVLFPVILAGTIGFMKSGQEQNTLKLKQIDVNIIDEDNSEKSKSLIELLKSDDMKALINVTDKGDADIKIPKGYEESILSKKENNIILVERDKGHSVLSTLKVILDKYHKNLYLSQSGEKNEELSEIFNKDVIDSEIIDYKEEIDSYQLMASSLSGFVISMMILNFIKASYTDGCGNLYRRILVAPISRQKFFLYESIGTFLYSLIILFCYTLFFKITGLAFKGSILGIFAIIIPSALLVTTITKFVTYSVLKEYGQFVGMIIFILPILGMEMFNGKGNLLANFAPTHYITKAFETFNLNGNIRGVEKDLLFIVAVSLLLFIIVFIKESLSKGGRRCA